MDRSKLAPPIAALILALPTAGGAADNELYDDPPPKDAVFVRWIEDKSAPKILGISMPSDHGDAFHPVSAAQTENATRGAFYTAAIDASGHLAIIEEPARRDKTKVLLTLLNLSSKPAHLVLTDQNVEVIDSVAVNEAGARAVNPVSATLSVVSSTGAVLGIFDVQLRRGQNITFVARPDGAALIENQFGPNIEG